MVRLSNILLCGLPLTCVNNSDLFNLYMQYILAVIDTVLVGYFQCRRGCVNRTWHSFFPTLCEFNFISQLFLIWVYEAQNIYSPLIWCVINHMSVGCAFRSGLQRQEYGCTACQKSWESWFQGNSPYCGHSTAWAQGGWYQEPVSANICSIKFLLKVLCLLWGHYSVMRS